MENFTLYQVNFLPWRQQQLIKKKRKFIVFCFVTCCSVAIACYFLLVFQYLEIENQQQRKHNHQLHYEQIQQVSLQISILQKRLDDLINKKQKLDNVIKHNQFLLSLLRSLPVITPEKSWLTNLQLIDNKIEIKANSYDFHDINSLRLKLKEQVSLGGVQLKNLNRVNQLNRLHLIATYQGAHYE